MRNKPFVPSASSRYNIIKEKILPFKSHNRKLFGKYELLVCSLNGEEKVMVPGSLQHQLME